MNGAGLKTGCIAGLGTSGVARIWEQRIVSSISWQRLGGFAEIDRGRFDEVMGGWI